MTRAIRTLVGLLALALLGAGSAAAQPSGTMTFGVHVTLATRWLDPMDTDSEITPFMILYAIHDALVKPMPGNLNAPCLAESWSVSKDGRTWENGFIRASGPRVEESGLTLIPAFPYSGPLEDVRLKKEAGPR